MRYWDMSFSKISARIYQYRMRIRCSKYTQRQRDATPSRATALHCTAHRRAAIDQLEKKDDDNLYHVPAQRGLPKFAARTCQKRRDSSRIPIHRKPNPMLILTQVDVEAVYQSTRSRSCRSRMSWYMIRWSWVGGQTIKQIFAAVREIQEDSFDKSGCLLPGVVTRDLE